MDGYFRMPKSLFAEARFRKLSDGAKLLYGIMLDRVRLSEANGWRDGKGEPYIFFTIENAMEMLGCGKQKAVKLMKELDSNGVGLIYRQNQGQGKPCIVYVDNIVDKMLITCG